MPGESQPADNKSFWTTLPGVLSGVAGILTAVGAIAGTLAANDVFPFNDPKPKPVPSNESKPKLASTPYEPLRSSGYQTVVPKGPEWSTKPESEVAPGLYRVSIFGPRGIEIWVDHTPDEKARFSRKGRAVQRRRTIDHPVFGLADEWVFRGGLPRCESSPCVDYLMNDSREGYAVLGGGGDYQTARSVAGKVALELTPR